MILKKFATGIATVGALGALFAPSAALANSPWNGSNNQYGGGGDTSVEIDVSKSLRVEQNASTTNSTSVVSVNNTGGNSISGTTGGNSYIGTGDALSNVEVVNHGTTNNLDLNACNCEDHQMMSFSGSSGNRNSDNDFRFRSRHEMNISQNAETNSQTDVAVVNNTGDNSIEGRTSGESDFSMHGRNWTFWKDWWNNHHNQGGDATIETGDAVSVVSVHNYGSKNNLSVH